jgi:hypothetical protein
MGTSTRPAALGIQDAELLALAVDSPLKFFEELFGRLRDETRSPDTNWTELLKETLKLRPMIDVELSRALVADVTILEERFVIHVLQILEDVSPGFRIMPILSRLSAHPSQKVQSKITRMLGRDKDYSSWLPQYLEHPDARVRANAIEATTVTDTPATRSLLRSFLSDPNNRVVGNALLALYRLGERDTIQLVIAMAGFEAPAFRASAAWVMGETGNPIFREKLQLMRQQEKGNVWTNVMRALNRIARAPKTDGASAAAASAPLSSDTSIPQPRSQSAADSPEPAADTSHKE